MNLIVVDIFFCRFNFCECFVIFCTVCGSLFSVNVCYEFFVVDTCDICDFCLY